MSTSLLNTHRWPAGDAPILAALQAQHGRGGVDRSGVVGSGVHVEFRCKRGRGIILKIAGMPETSGCMLARMTQTGHFNSDGTPRYTNQLAHADQPVPAPARAQPGGLVPVGRRRPSQRALTERKPIHLSVGYSACHWCHVMADESFEDEATARCSTSTSSTSRSTAKSAPTSTASTRSRSRCSPSAAAAGR